MPHGFALGCCLEPSLPARVGFTIERLRHGRRPTCLAQHQDVHQELAALGFYAQLVAHPDLHAGRADAPLESTRPSSQAFEAMDRDLKKRAAHNHLSISLHHDVSYPGAARVPANNRRILQVVAQMYELDTLS